MDIRNIRQLKEAARQRLDGFPNHKRIVLIYSGIALGLTALVSIINLLLSLQISNYGGLSNLGMRSILSTIQTILPIFLTLVLMPLGLGYLAAMLRIARDQYTSPQTLRLGFDRFWPLLRLNIVKGLIFTVIGFVCMYAGISIFVMTPFAEPLMELLTPILTSSSVMTSGFVIDDALAMEIASMMWPALAISAVVFCIAAAPVMYQYRMAEYVLIDRPALGALAVLRESRKMMRGNRMALLRLDLSLWKYYGGLLIAYLICYGDQILPALGISLPFSAGVSYYLFYFAYIAVLFAVYYFLRNRAEVTLALAYESVKPAEPQQKGVVLGNIFQM